jgi:hypothetical protein
MPDTDTPQTGSEKLEEFRVKMYRQGADIESATITVKARSREEAPAAAIALYEDETPSVEWRCEETDWGPWLTDMFEVDGERVPAGPVKPVPSPAPTIGELEHRLQCVRDDFFMSQRHARAQAEKIYRLKAELGRVKVASWAGRHALEAAIPMLQAVVADAPSAANKCRLQAAEAALAYQGGPFRIALWTLTIDTPNFEGCQVYTSEIDRNDTLRAMLLEYATDSERAELEKIDDVSELNDAVRARLDRETVIYIPEVHELDISGAEPISMTVRA